MSLAILALVGYQESVLPSKNSDNLKHLPIRLNADKLINLLPELSTEKMATLPQKAANPGASRM
jgi:hypothetical protein